MYFWIAGALLLVCIGCYYAVRAWSSKERLVESWSAELGDQTKTAAGEEQGGVAVVLAEDQDTVDKEQASSGGEVASTALEEQVRPFEGQARSTHEARSSSVSTSTAGLAPAFRTTFDRNSGDEI